MLFNQYIFWLFFLIVVLLYRRLRHRAQNRMLLVASYVFYGYWDWRFLFLILGSTLVDYFVAQKVDASEDTKRKRQWLLVSLCANLGTLGFFKYFGFFTTELVRILNGIGFHVTELEMNIVLPVGISFYTFQTLSYTIDVYKGHMKPEKNFWDFALYVSFFPQLVAGPIERSGRLMPQIVALRKCGTDDFSIGLYHVLTGLFKKVVIADNMAVFVNTVFETPADERTALLCLVGIYAFAFQIYGDFSGYSSIAKGVARWLGFDLMTNFKQPYFSRGPAELWRRWHISLSTWLRDYIFIPLSIGKNTVYRTWRNLVITMTLGGLWHGANWTFIFWGLFHGLWLCVEMWLRQKYPPRADASRLTVLRQVLITFHLVCFGYVLFRAESISDACIYIATIFTDWSLSGFAATGAGLILFYVTPLIAFEYWVERKGDEIALVKSNWLFRAVVYSYIALMLLFFHAPVSAEFIYFQF